MFRKTESLQFICDVCGYVMDATLTTLIKKASDDTRSEHLASVEIQTGNRTRTKSAAGDTIICPQCKTRHTL